MKALPLFALALLCAAPAVASVTVNTPGNGAVLTSPFSLLASASPCTSQPIVAMGYSLDDSASTQTVMASTLSVSVTAPAGTHILHVKSWGNRGAPCVTNVTVNVEKANAAAMTSNLSVAAPLNGASVSSPFAVSATGTLCDGQAVAGMGYSLDSSASTTILTGQSISGSAAASAGSHTLHVKAWGKSGAACVTNVAISVPEPAPSGPSIPAGALVTDLIQNLTAWTAEHDTGTTGTSNGTMSLVASPAVSGSARQFATTYTNYGGERYNIGLAPDTISTNFVYDVQIYIASPSNEIANIEMDLNQVMPNGETVIYGFQCDGWSHTWDYTANTGTPTSPEDNWLHSTQKCNPQTWPTNTWHHLQVQYSRDSSGNVTYKAVWFDGVEQDLNVTVLSAFALHWAPALNSNFQIDGYTSTSGSATVYLDKLTLYHW